MNDLNLIWIWWNISTPNPRLPAYLYTIIKDITEKKVDILLTSSVNHCLLSEADEKSKQLIVFNTNQKIKLICTFLSEFYSNKVNTIIDFSEETDQYNIEEWILLRKELENILSEEEKIYISSIITKFWKWEKNYCLAYIIRHIFWFKDYSFNDEYYNINLESIWWEQESFFNLITHIQKTLLKIILLCSYFKR